MTNEDNYTQVGNDGIGGTYATSDQLVAGWFTEWEKRIGDELEKFKLGIKLNGVLSGLACSEDAGGASRYVDVAVGEVYIDGVVYPEFTAKTNLQLAAADLTYDRYDLVYYDVATSEASYVTGAASAIPTIPDIPASDIPLAIVKREANDNTIVDADIMDKRIFVRAPNPCLWGDGTDGALDVTGTTNITAPMQYSTLKISNGGTLQLNADEPLIIKAQRYIWLESGGEINADYHGAPGGTGATADGNETAGTDGYWGDGGDGGLPGNGVGGDSPASYFQDVYKTMDFSTSGDRFMGACGGGGGGWVVANPGGDGGDGGGLILLFAPLIYLESGGTISALGEDGSNSGGVGAGYGGGGGGGGSIVATYITKTDGGATITLTGGSGGTGSAGNGTAGSNGVELYRQVV